MTTNLQADDNGLVLPEGVEVEGTYDVLLNDLHVWSLTPERDAKAVGGRLVARWPKGLERHLRGRARIVLRDHVSGAELARGDHVFRGDTEAEVQVTDRAGNPLILDKYGRLTRPLAGEDSSTLDHLMDQVVELLQALNDRAGVPAFVSYGTLLGAARSGQLIGHDNDVDLTYVSLQAAPVDVIREGYRVERALKDAGFVVRRGSGTRLNVRLPQADGTLRFVDVFTAHWVDGILYTPQDTGFELPVSTILPLTTVQLHGREVPAPADYERLLAETYGPSWRVPDPSFKYDTPRWLARRIAGWFGGLRAHRKPWDTFYGGPGRQLTRKPSPFAEWVQERDPSSRAVLDVGAGNCRDSMFFARQGRRVTAVEFSQGILERTARRLDERLPGLSLVMVNLNDSREVLALGTEVSHRDEPTDVYCRLTLDAVEPLGRENILRLASMALRREGHLYLEFRTPRDKGAAHHFDLPRKFLEPDDVVREIERRGGTVVHRESGRGLAPFEEEDPHVCRIVASWSSRS
jgi:SAM-dependent methyltransferase